MENLNFDTPMNAERMPIVRIKDGEVFANSRDVAEFFEKRHDNVLRDIGGLLNSEETLRRRHFIESSYTDPQNGQSYRSFDMTRDGFTLLAMGFTGSKALKWKIKYIEAFNVMEAELRGRPAIDPMKVLNDPEAMRGLLLNYTEKVLELQDQISEMQPKVEAHDRIAEAYGSFNRTNAAKMLQVPPMALIRWLRTNGWTYRRTGDPDDIGYQSKISAGLLEHKITTGLREDGTTWTNTQVRITAKGLTVLAKAFPPAAKKVG